MKTIDQQHLSLGWILGFREKQYTYANDYKLTDDTQYGKYLKDYQVKEYTTEIDLDIFYWL